MSLDPKIWGPQYWFVFHTIALNYPVKPNETSKKKYYDFIQNIPLFIPIENMGNLFNDLLDKYPVTPYLDSRESIIKWFHFIHNKMNVHLNIPEKTMQESLHNYYKNYEPVERKLKEVIIKKQHYIFMIIIIFLISISVNMYKR